MKQQQTNWTVSAETVRAFFQKNKLNRKTYKLLAKKNKLPKGFGKIPTRHFDKPWSWFSGNKAVAKTNIKKGQTK